MQGPAIACDMLNSCFFKLFTEDAGNGNPVMEAIVWCDVPDKYMAIRCFWSAMKDMVSNGSQYLF